MATSIEGFSDAFEHWLKSKGINIKATNRERRIAVFAGDAQNPQTGISFKWTVQIYFDIEK